MSSSTLPPNITPHLLALSPSAYQTATRAPFLNRAGKGTLARETLEQWLQQDRLYAQAYVRFAARAVAGIGLPARVEEGALSERSLDLFLDALTNVRRELKFFEDVAKRYNLNLSAPVTANGEVVESQALKWYKGLFEKYVIGEGTVKDGVFESLVLMWGTEKCYLEAWTYASSFLHDASSRREADDADGGALRKEFIPNWSSEEFVGFVERIEGMVDEVWKGFGEQEKEAVLSVAEGIWIDILKVEKAFWPVVEE